jgi:alpha-methylacyl-CoA racemase
MGPLSGYKIIEMAGLGPGPFCGMLLADMGAEIICVDRSTKADLGMTRDCSRRGKRSIVLNLKTTEGTETLLKLVEQADALFEGFRPGVMERLGIGPEICLERNPRLVYGRMTGWGQTGPLAHAAGHDINYISLTGSLHAIGRSGEKPVPPLNMVGDFGGGGMFLAFGLVCALLESKKSGLGQVIDAAMTDGSAVLMAMINTMHASGRWVTNRGSNMLDSGAHFYDVYETGDGKYISIGSIEPQFYALLMEKAGLCTEVFGQQWDEAGWPELKRKLEAIFKTRTRDEWCDLMEGTDVCFAPVLDIVEAPDHPHNKARKTYFELDGFMQPAPAPRFSRTGPEVSHGARQRGADSDAILLDCGFDPETISVLREQGTIS